MYSSSSFLKCGIDSNLCKYNSSDFKCPKKFSITALSKQLAFLDILLAIRATSNMDESGKVSLKSWMDSALCFSVLRLITFLDIHFRRH